MQVGWGRAVYSISLVNYNHFQLTLPIKEINPPQSTPLLNLKINLVQCVWSFKLKNEEEFLHTQRENDIQLRVNTSGYTTAQVQAKRTKYGTEFIFFFFFCGKSVTRELHGSSSRNQQSLRMFKGPMHQPDKITTTQKGYRE